jgi:lipopolysaccharide export system ATP-binding protein
VQLSGGERRRCEIARALAIDPKFILLDEPFAGVDPIAVEDIQHIISKLKTKNIGIVITDHNVHETLAITDRAYLLYEGSILESGTAEVLANNPEVRRKYLGQNFELRKAVLKKKKKEEGTEIPHIDVKSDKDNNSGTGADMSGYSDRASDLERGA